MKMALLIWEDICYYGFIENIILYQTKYAVAYRHTFLESRYTSNPMLLLAAFLGIHSR